MELADIYELQRELDVLRGQHLDALAGFRVENGPGFWRTFEPRHDMSEVSTATAVLSILRAHTWDEWLAEIPEDDRKYWTVDVLCERLLSDEAWGNASLGRRNPYHVAFVTGSALQLVAGGRAPSRPIQERLVLAAEIIRCELLRKEGDEACSAQSDMSKRYPHARSGSISIQFAPSAHLTHLAVRSLRELTEAIGRWDTEGGLEIEVGDKWQFDTEVKEAVLSWAWDHLTRQIVLSNAKSPTADPFEIAYAVAIVASVDAERPTPDQRMMMKTAVDVAFGYQDGDSGSWPRSHPLFHHEKIGTAYSYDYEMLAQLLAVPMLHESLLEYLDHLAKATRLLRLTDYDQGTARRWSSGHIPYQESPESWATASVYQFAHELDRLLAEAIRQELFDYVGAEYRPIAPVEHLGRDMVDSSVGYGSSSLLEVLRENVGKPVRDSTLAVRLGRSMPKGAPVSIVLYGPPGTSKTTLAEELAAFIGWPLLPIDPSHLVRQGFDRLQSEVDTIFGMLASAEGVVVLLDEFDEMVRGRDDEQTELISRLLTTAMLPKLAAMNRRRRLLFVVATNNIDAFDPAVIRQGRFDLVLPVFPPGLPAKLAHWPRMQEALKDAMNDSRVRDCLDRMGFKDFESLVARLDGMAESRTGPLGVDEIKDEIRHTWESSAVAQDLATRSSLKVTSPPDDDSAAMEKAVNSMLRYARLPPTTGAGSNANPAV